MTRRRLFGLSLAPLFAPLLAWLPGRRAEPPVDYFYEPTSGLDLDAFGDITGRCVVKMNRTHLE